jgi:hypothetical protein
MHQNFSGDVEVFDEVSTVGEGLVDKEGGKLVLD